MKETAALHHNFYQVGGSSKLGTFAAFPIPDTNTTQITVPQPTLSLLCLYTHGM